MDEPTLGIADPERMTEAWGSELYAISFNDGYILALKGHRLEKPYWWAYREAKKLGHRWPRDYAHGFCDGYRLAVQHAQTNRSEDGS